MDSKGVCFVVREGEEGGVEEGVDAGEGEGDEGDRPVIWNIYICFQWIRERIAAGAKNKRTTDEGEVLGG